MRVLFATAELRPLVSVGGLGEAATGLVSGLRARGLDVVVALPDYGRWELVDERVVELSVPEWAHPAAARIGDHVQAGQIALIDVPGIERPNPYVDESGQGWPDNDRRFIGFSAAVASLATELAVDVVHLNDWHTSYVPAFLGEALPSLVTIHNLAHQGWADARWFERLPRHHAEYTMGDAVNGLAGALRLADRVVAVSPTYAAEIVTEGGGLGLHEVLADRGDALQGVLNGIDTAAWAPDRDVHTPQFSADDLTGKAKARAALLDRVGWTDTGEPLIVMVTRLVEQKGVDLAFTAGRFLPGMKARLIVLGSGDAELARWGEEMAAEMPDRFWFENGYDAPLSHLLFSGGDLLLMPSRFEPCGLAQMQAMAYGTIPIVTPVGGLSDTVIDADRSKDGNGFVATSVDGAGVVDAIHRSLRATRHARRKAAIQRRGMEHDWSWSGASETFAALYDEIASTG